MALGKIGTNQIDTAATPTVASATVTGDLTVDTNTLYVDSTNNNVGIGGSPTENFEVFGAATNGVAKIGQLMLKNSSGNYAASTDGVHIFPFSDGNTYINNFDGGFVFRTGASVERMRIDSSGRVTMPYQPSFQVQLTTQSNAGSGAIVTGWGGIHNIGGHFANNRFTAPVAGRYVISYSGLHNTGTGYYGRAYLYKNGASIFDGLSDNAAYGQYVRLSWTLIVDLAANDYLQIYADSNNSAHYVYNHYTHWSGHLLG